LVKCLKPTDRDESMAKIKRRKLKWSASNSAQVVGYKLYWSENGKVHYDSKCVLLGNVTEIVLPDDVHSFRPNGGSIEFGITAIDELGNESDMTTLKAPYQFRVPEAPDDLYLRKLEDFSVTGSHRNPEDDRVDYYITGPSHDGSDEKEPIRLVDLKSRNRLNSGSAISDFNPDHRIRRVFKKR
jgi:hypothetical protein